MSPSILLVSFFFFTLAAVGAAGYVFVLRPAKAEGGENEPIREILNQPDLPVAQAAVLDMFRLIGDAIPGKPAQRAAVQEMLSAAGFRWPAAISVFRGIKL